MAQKFPENLPPKGRGRVDDKHQIALLTDFEIAALNTLKNRDKERGFPSGSGPEIRALAAQNSRPFEFVNYRGERIPSLNDFSEGGYGGGGDSGSSAGESEARQQTQSGGDYGGSNDWATKQRQKAIEEARKKREREWAREQEKKAKKKQADLKKIQDYLDWYDNVNKQGSTDYQDFEGENYGTDDRPERDPGYRPPRPGEEGYQEPSRFREQGDQPPLYPDMSEEEFNQLTEEYDLKPEFADWEGNMHWSQDAADSANQDYRDTKFSGISGYEHEGIGGDYVDAYQQQLSDAYDAAYRGVEMDIGDTGYFKGGEFEALADAKTGQEQWLKDLGTAYEAQQKATYDTWYQDNMDKINALGSKEEVDAYEWTDPGFDLDLTGGKGFGSEDEYSADYIPDFYEGFRKEFDENYDPGQGMPDTWGGHPENVETEDAEIEGRDNNVRRVKKKSNFAPSSGISPFSSGSAKYY